MHLGLFLFWLSCSAVIVFKGKEYRDSAITKLLKGLDIKTLLNDGNLQEADFSKLTSEDLEYIPSSYIPKASKLQADKIKSLKSPSPPLRPQTSSMTVVGYGRTPGTINFVIAKQALPKPASKILQLNFDKKNMKWISKLDPAMQNIMWIKATDQERLPSYPDPTCRGSYRTPFLMQDPPMIARLFRCEEVHYGKSATRASWWRYRISKQYSILKGTCTIDANEEDIYLITEWALIGLIFHGTDLSKHQAYFNRLLYIPADFARSKSSTKTQGLMSTAESIKLMQLQKRANVSLWNALLHVALECIRADPEMENLPLLEKWEKRQQAPPAASRRSAFKTVTEYPLVIGVRKNGLKECLDEIEKRLLSEQPKRSEIVSLFFKALQELNKDTIKIPHSPLIAEELEKLICGLKSEFVTIDLTRND